MTESVVHHGVGSGGPHPQGWGAPTVLVVEFEQDVEIVSEAEVKVTLVLRLKGRHTWKA